MSRISVRAFVRVVILGCAAALPCGVVLADATTKPVLDFSPRPPVQPLSPEEELKTFQLPEGYRLELVMSEKDSDIKEPVVCVFDGNGRMYIAEMRTYMQDIDGNNELALAGRVSRHESTHGDGKFDKHIIYADHLLLPRMVLPLDDRVLINETNTNDINIYHDSKGDGIADSKTLFYAGGPRGGNLEHQQSGLVWCQDNWIYQAANSDRLRYTGKEVLHETTPGNGGQWGLCQDNYGKMWFSNAGAEKGPIRFQIPIAYGAIDLPDELEPDFLTVWPLVGLADVQGGTSRFRPENRTLNHFTASCGQEIFRGDRLPQDIRGDFLIGEPVGRLIRRAKVDDRDGMTYLRNANPGSEFIRSTDPCFRPINMTTGPDGCLYIVDMYRGIIQEGNWVREGSYLRKVVQQYSLDRPTGRGRIWRLVHKDFTPGPQPNMLQETPAQLVAHLEHPNGWWRDTAQKLLILRGDKSVVPALTQMVHEDKEPLARIHAIWTLEGLDTLDAGLVREKLKDSDAHVRVAAMRAGESLIRKGDKSLLPDYQAMSKDKDPDVVLQSLLTAKALNLPDFSSFAQLTMAATPAHGVKEIGAALLNGHEIDPRQFSKTELEQLYRGKAIYEQLCFACHGFAGTGMPQDGSPPGTTLAPPLAFSREVLDHRETLPRILLNGLAGPVGGKTYVAQMVPMNTNDDQWIADVSSYVRNEFGNRATLVSAADVAKLRPAAKSRTTPWTIDELRGLYPRPAGNPSQWKVTASVNSAAAHLAIDGKYDTRWVSKDDLAPGMWIQIELPEATMIGGLLVDAVKSPADYAREYTVEVSSDGKEWGNPVAKGKGTPGVLEIGFKPVKAKFVRLTQTGKLKPKEKLFWSVNELLVLEP